MGTAGKSVLLDPIPKSHFFYFKLPDFFFPPDFVTVMLIADNTENGDRRTLCFSLCKG